MFSFTEGRSPSLKVRVANSDTLDRQGESPIFDLPLDDVEAFVEARGFRLTTLRSASALAAQFNSEFSGRIGVLRYMHLAVAEAE